MLPQPEETFLTSFEKGNRNKIVAREQSKKIA
jgi:hypothetical protein